MNFFDDLKSRVEQSAQNFQGDFNNYISNNITQPLAKIGQAATGNLSEAEIKAGKTAQPPPVVPAQLPAPTVAMAGMSVGVMLALAAGAYFLFFKKGRS